MSAGTISRTAVVFQAADAKVAGHTNFGMSRKLLATSTIGPVLDSSRSAVGQNPAFGQSVTRPSRKAPAVRNLSLTWR
jgi:hypothetical protein